MVTNTETLINTLDSKLNDLKGKLEAPCDEEAQCELDEIHKDIKRRIHQFESKRIIIITVGMLKAGKSTLVNLLAENKYATPVGYGHDTTLNPALITMDKNEQEGRIYVYTLNDDDLLKIRQKALQNILDEKRELTNQQRSYSVRTLSLTEKDLTETLCKKSSDIPWIKDKDKLLLVEVKIPYNQNNELLAGQWECMLLDMPGLDSENADIAQLINDYLAFIKESDLLLFIQSSVAPLNQKAVDFLTQILDVRSNATFQVIQNRMEARHWLNKETLKEEEEKQKEHAKKAFKELAKDPNFDISLSSNFGMAYDGLLGDDTKLAEKSYHLLEDNQGSISKATLLRCSEYNELKDELKKKLAECRTNHCYETLKHSYEAHKDTLNKLRTDYTEEKTKAEKAINAWNEVEKQIDPLVEEHKKIIDPMKFELCDNFSNKLKEQIEIIQGDAIEYCKFPPPGTGSFKKKGREIDDFLDKINKQIHVKLTTDTDNFFNLEDIQDANGKSARDMCAEKLQEIEKEFRDKTKTTDKDNELVKNVATAYSTLENLFNFSSNEAPISSEQKKIRPEISEYHINDKYANHKRFFWGKTFEIDLDHPIWEKTLKKFINKNTKSIIENSIEQSLSKPIKEIKEQIKKKYNRSRG